MSRTSSVKSADRVIDVLELLSRRGKGLPHAQLAYDAALEHELHSATPA